MERKTYKPYPDNGTLRATQSKKTPKSPDYWGNIAINMKDLTNIHTEEGLTVVKLSGWKKVGADGKTYLSISVDRFVPENTSRPKPETRTVESMDDDVPF